MVGFATFLFWKRSETTFSSECTRFLSLPYPEFSNESCIDKYLNTGIRGPPNLVVDVLVRLRNVQPPG
jgi:hypothetical protein